MTPGNPQGQEREFLLRMLQGQRQPPAGVQPQPPHVAPMMSPPMPGGGMMTPPMPGGGMMPAPMGPPPMGPAPGFSPQSFEPPQMRGRSR